MAETPNLKLMLDSALFNFNEGKIICDKLMKQSNETSEIIVNSSNPGTALKSMFSDMASCDKLTNLSDADWERLGEMYEISEEVRAGKRVNRMKFKKYQNKPYAEMIYFPKNKSSTFNKNNIMRWEMCGGEQRLFDAISDIPDSVVAGSVGIEDELINSMESFFENYNSESDESIIKAENISKWKNISSYDEFLQVPLLKEGHSFMNKFLNIEEQIKAGEVVPVSELEDLIPNYMRGGNLTLMEMVDPTYSREAYVLSKNVSDLTIDMINRAFINSFAAVRGSTLADVKSILLRLEQVVKMITKKSNTLVDNSKPSITAGITAGKKTHTK